VLKIAQAARYRLTAHHGPRAAALGRWIEQSGVKTSISAMLLIALAHAAVLGLIGMMLVKAGWGFMIGAIVGFALPFMFLNMKRKRRMRRSRRIPGSAGPHRRALKAGHAFVTGLKMVADEMPEPIGPEFRKTFDEQNFGLPLKDALENLTMRVPGLDVRFFATAVLIQRETGGNLSEILENLAHVVRERFRFAGASLHGAWARRLHVLGARRALRRASFINPDQHVPTSRAHGADAVDGGHRDSHHTDSASSKSRCNVLPPLLPVLAHRRRRRVCLAGRSHRDRSPAGRLTSAREKRVTIDAPPPVVTFFAYRRKAPRSTKESRMA
jgi:hypothetical protein